ncbi:MAG: methyl-accepting chemotaxis protein [Planctomycetota bacterium]
MTTENTTQEKKPRKASKPRGNSASEVLNQVESLMTVVNQAVEGDWEQEITVSGDNAVGHLADGLQALLKDFAETKNQLVEYHCQLEALSRSNAVIEFELDGTIITANDNFLNTLGYSLEEVRGQHHRMFVDRDFAGSREYQQMWRELAQGEFKAGEFKRIHSDGSTIWIQASYNPVFDVDGKPCRVVKYASDITDAKTEAVVKDGKLKAINTTQAVIEFTIAGEVVTANDNFCQVMGYSLDEIKGRHHRTFVDKDHASSTDYSRFWDDLARGESKGGHFTCFRKNGEEVILQAVYTPITDAEGQVTGVIQLATDITEESKTAEANALINAMMEHAPAMIFADTDCIIRYMNPVAAKTLRTLEQHLPVRVDDMVGETIDVFHKNPHHQRGILADPRNLPIKASINIGPETLELEVSPVHDDNREYIGAMVSWEVVTEKLRMEADIRASQEEDRRKAEEMQRKVETVLEIVNNIAAGRFDVEFPDLGNDGIAQVASALSTAVSAVRDALIEVRDVSGTVAAASTQMSSAAEEISRGAQQQAARLEETASSLEEITTTVKQNSENAQEARNLANNSRDIATKGGSVVGDAVEAMAEINNSSKKISDIITTIDEIAFQTNLLALNAAVEAARAGEQGRGFAVVASEVRNLAQRSASSAKEIKTLIQDSASKVETGTSLVNKSGETLGEIVDSVKRVTDIVAEIAAASQEQLTAIEQVNTAVTQMDHVTQANASQTEELAGTSGSLLDHSRRLEQRVSAFELGGGAAPAAYAPPAAPAGPPPAAPAAADDFMDF